jgi:hypothetical protein
MSLFGIDNLLSGYGSGIGPKKLSSLLLVQAVAELRRFTGCGDVAMAGIGPRVRMVENAKSRGKVGAR